MTQPVPYSRSFSFTDFSASFPTTPHQGPAIDSEFNGIGATFAGVLSNLARLQRDDGALKNQIVTLDSLSPAAVYALGAGSQWVARGAWAFATVYAISDVVSMGTGTYVCAAAHTAVALFATDLAAGRWVKLFDDEGTIPADGSVTALKIAAGAVTTAAIGFTSLSLIGNIKAATGLQAGIAPSGSLLHAKAADGPVLAKVERVTDAQATVGYQIIGETITWEFSQATGGTDCDVLRGGVRVGSFRAHGTDAVGTVRATAGAFPTTGTGIGMSYVAGIGYVTAVNYDTGAWSDLKLRGKKVYLTASAVDVVEVDATGVTVTGTVKRGAVELGWLDVPQNAQNAAYTLALADRGKHVYSKNVAGQTIVLPTNAAAAFPLGTAIAIVNRGSNPITLTAAGVTLRFAGTTMTGTRTIAVNGMATLLKVETNVWMISGAGIA